VRWGDKGRQNFPEKEYLVFIINILFRLTESVPCLKNGLQKLLLCSQTAMSETKPEVDYCEVSTRSSDKANFHLNILTNPKKTMELRFQLEFDPEASFFIFLLSPSR
jgi:hypothetical protein